MFRSLLMWLAAVFVASNLFPAHAWAWGEDGHYIVAFIAKEHLSLKARTSIQDLIGHPTRKSSQ